MTLRVVAYIGTRKWWSHQARSALNASDQAELRTEIFGNQALQSVRTAKERMIHVDSLDKAHSLGYVDGFDLEPSHMRDPSKVEYERIIAVVASLSATRLQPDITAAFMEDAQWTEFVHRRIDAIAEAPLPPGPVIVRFEDGLISEFETPRGVTRRIRKLEDVAGVRWTGIIGAAPPDLRMAAEAVHAQISTWIDAGAPPR